MKTKLVAYFFALVMFCSFSTLVMADPIHNGDQVYVADGIGSVGGGIMIVKDLGYNSLFETFCLELNEGFRYDPFTVHIDTYAIAGGLGGVNPGDPGDYISIPTAYLYFSFRNGTIPGFVKNEFNVNALQFAFWNLENEVTFSPVDLAAQVAQYIAFANSSNWTDIGPVAVLNLTNTQGAQQQSLLTLVPEPASMILFGLGLLGLAGLRRKLKK